MTICIAAACSETSNGGDSPRLIFCSDWQVSGPLGKSQTKHKQEWLQEGWVCLIAGDPVEASAVVKSLRRKFHNVNVDETNARPLIQEALYERRNELRNALAQARFGMGHDEVLKTGKERLPVEHFIRYLPVEHFIRYLDDAAKIRLETEFILAGFSASMSIIIETTQDCDVSFQEPFSCIGEGELLARASLLSRELTDVRDIGVALYEVYEAKRAAERVRSVGGLTLLTVLHPDGKQYKMDLTKMGYLEGLYAKYGPKATPLTLELPAGLLLER